MGTASPPAEVTFFFGVLYHPEVPLDSVLGRLDERFGTRQFEYGPVPFSWSDYYTKEMGGSLEKYYYSYQTGIDRATLPDIKRYTNSLESSFSDPDGKRRVNIDPGYVARDKVVLATTKDFYHRLYLADGIFGEVTLHYRRGKFRYFSWTYPDFRDPEVMRFLERIRAPLVKAIRDKG